jgi:hypothetical protein
LRRVFGAETRSDWNHSTKIDETGHGYTFGANNLWKTKPELLPDEATAPFKD